MADKLIEVVVRGRRAIVVGNPSIVCGNSDYTIQFTFDDEWADHPAKTVRFVYVQRAQVKYQDTVIYGDTVQVPVLSNTTVVRVGVFAGDLCTTTPAVIPCELSIRCGTGVPDNPAPDVYDQIMALLDGIGPGGVGTDKFVSDYRIVSQPDTAGHTLVLIYNDGTELAVPLPQMGIDIDDVIQFGTSDPTGNTSGATKQLYINTSTGKMWVCKNGLVRPVQWISLNGGKTEIIDGGETVTVKFGG